ncbi:hypothetical protein C6341_g8990 [Phytophthora cactorum]|uniref:Uncharacterized protein n=1 Tax=Phytophthora cactorum TaxID=29920 RepID=A0A8T1D6A6_9STRA|nr:hypothetical protein PC117_g12277 [Phytophthora cactorum]KAG3176373.1 hypothetical protein C6341_g8990 [Phytophthora cactorum]
MIVIKSVIGAISGILKAGDCVVFVHDGCTFTSKDCFGAPERDSAGLGFVTTPGSIFTHVDTRITTPRHAFIPTSHESESSAVPFGSTEAILARECAAIVHEHYAVPRLEYSRYCTDDGLDDYLLVA